MDALTTTRCFVIVALSCQLSATVGVFSGPQDTSVLQGGMATLYCSNPDYSGPGVTQWSEDGTTFANAGGVFIGGKYTNFAVDTGSTSPVTQLNLVISNADITDEGTYTCQITPDETSAALKVEIQVTSVTITVDGGTPVIAREGVEMSLVCSALGARPAVSIVWTNDGIAIPDDTELVTENGDVSDTRSTLLFTPSKEDDGHQLTCQTAGQVVAPAQSKDISLNVQFPPYVTVGYSGGMVTCSADANPLATSYEIILNGTEVYRTFTNNGQSVEYMPDYCTTISCNATNTLGTGTVVLTEQICPEDLEPVTSTENPAANSKEPPLAELNVSALIGVLVPVAALFGIASLVGVVVVRRRRQRRRGEGESPRGTSDVAAVDSDYSVLDQAQPMHVYNVVVSLEQVPRDQTDETYTNVGADMSFPRELLAVVSELGRGAFGRVLLATIPGLTGGEARTKVAVKTLKEGADRQARSDLLAELDVMKKVGTHPNVVRLLGHCTEADPIYVMVEHMGRGDLKAVLLACRTDDPGSPALSRTLIGFARDVAAGMAFVSSMKCVHRDLAARNVLVSDDMVCKVSDFGLARDVMNVRIYQRQSEGGLPMRWMALESIIDDVYSKESDVWSFGVLLWEIVTMGARPYALLRTNEMIERLQTGYRMPRPQHCSMGLYDMMRACWQSRPTDRPAFQLLHEQLNRMLTEEEDYITVRDIDESIYEVVKVDSTNERL